MDVTLTIHRKDGTTQQVPVLLRIDTPIEVDYYLNGGILPFVLRELMTTAASGLREEGLHEMHAASKYRTGPSAANDQNNAIIQS